jgi:carboxylesterase
MALHLAANNSGIRGVVTMGAMGSPRFFRDWRLRMLWGLKYLVRWHVPGDDVDLGNRDAVLTLHSYARRPTVCIESLLRFLRVLENELPRIRIPALVLHGRNDRTVATDNAPFILERLGSPDKTLRWFERSGHAITVDLEKDRLNQDVARWLDAH